MAKLKYLIPDMSVVEFEVEDDILMASSGGGLKDGGDLDSQDDNIHIDDVFPR